MVSQLASLFASVYLQGELTAETPTGCKLRPCVGNSEKARMQA